MNRRDLLKTTAFFVAAPAVGNIMRIAEPKIFLYGDGHHDDHFGVQAYLDGKQVYDFYTGELCSSITHRTLRIDRKELFFNTDYKTVDHNLIYAKDGVHIAGRGNHASFSYNHVYGFSKNPL